jgi:hypothetical protein
VGDNLVFVARSKRQSNPLHLSGHCGLGPGDFPSLDARGIRTVPYPIFSFFGGVAEGVTFGLRAGDVVKVYDTAWTANPFPTSPGVLETRLHPLLGQRPIAPSEKKPEILTLTMGSLSGTLWLLATR